MADPKHKIKAADVIANLKIWFPPRQYAFLQQVAPGTGARHYRWADAVAMSVWPSRGYDVHGIEVKISRGDWLNELRNPEKSDAVQRFCNRWWIATPDAAMIQPGELPPTWGHMVMKGDTMKVISAAPALEPEPLTIEFIGSVLRNVQTADETDVQRRIREALNEAAEKSQDYYKGKYEGLKTALEAFEAASGISIHHYSDGKELGEAVKTLRGLKWKTDTIRRGLETCIEVESLMKKILELPAIKECVEEPSELTPEKNLQAQADA